MPAEKAVATATKPKKMGRKSIKTPEMIEEICEQIAEGRSLASADYVDIRFERPVYKERGFYLSQR